MTVTANNDNSSRRLSLLIILLLGLHILFGITAIMGVLLAHKSLAATLGTVYHSHLRWQIATFWLAFIGYAVALRLWITTDILWPALGVFSFVLYRLTVNVYHWLKHQPINRVL